MVVQQPLIRQGYTRPSSGPGIAEAPIESDIGTELCNRSVSFVRLRVHSLDPILRFLPLLLLPQPLSILPSAVVLRGTRAPHNLPPLARRPPLRRSSRRPSHFAPVAVKHYFGSASQPARARVRSTETAREETRRPSKRFSSLFSYTTSYVPGSGRRIITRSTGLLFARACIPSSPALLPTRFPFLLLDFFHPFAYETKADVITRMTQ